MNCVDDFEPFKNLTEEGMFSIEPRGGGPGDKELAAVGVGATVCHGEFAFGVVGEFGAEFIFEGVTRATGAVSEGAAGLDDEVADDAMEAQIVVKSNKGKIYKVCYGEGGFFCKEFDGDGSAGGEDVCTEGVHG